MIRRSRLALFLVTGLALAGPTLASFHSIQIEQVIGGLDGDPRAQAIQLRMREDFQELVSQGKLMVRDAAGLNPITVIDMTTSVAGSDAGNRVLVTTAALQARLSPTVIPDFTMTTPIPQSYLAAGSLTWERDSPAGSVLWRLSWGGAGYFGLQTGETTNDADGNFGPAFAGPLPACSTQALRFPGLASDPSTNNAADYALTAGAAVFTNNAGTSGTVQAAAAPAALKFWSVTPCRAFTSVGGTPLASGVERLVPVVGAVCGIPVDAVAVSLNLTATSASNAGNFALYPNSTCSPGFPSLSFTANQTRANNAVMALSAGGDGKIVLLFSGGGTKDAIVDVNGYFIPP